MRWSNDLTIRLEFGYLRSVSPGIEDEERRVTMSEIVVVFLVTCRWDSLFQRCGRSGVVVALPIIDRVRVGGVGERLCLGTQAGEVVDELDECTLVDGRTRKK